MYVIDADIHFPIHSSFCLMVLSLKFVTSIFLKTAEEPSFFVTNPIQLDALYPHRMIQQAFIDMENMFDLLEEDVEVSMLRLQKAKC